MSSQKHFRCVVGEGFCAVAVLQFVGVWRADEKCPNILWLTAEDIGPETGCSGDTMANTPSIDQFDKSAMQYKTAGRTTPFVHRSERQLSQELMRA